MNNFIKNSYYGYNCSNVNVYSKSKTWASESGQRRMAML